VPIAGRPPSLINLPGGCSFHPRCPYVKPAHMKVDPKLEPIPDDPRHRVACLLAHDTRRKLWSELREGKSPVDARTAVMHDVAAEGSVVQAAGDTGSRAASAVEDPATEETGA